MKTYVGRRMKHTKGIWKMNTFANGNVENENGRSIASCMGYSTNGGNGEHIEENIANAKLITAAPDLLNACLEFVRKVECGEARSKRLYEQMKDAIEKAIG